MSDKPSNIKWAKYSGHRLVKSVSLEMDGNVIDRYTHCSQCGELYRNMYNTSWVCIQCLAYNTFEVVQKLKNLNNKARKDLSYKK